MNSIFWKGVRSTTIPGLLICELPPISKPTMRIKETVIDGRDGSVVEDLGYSSYNKTILIGLHGEYDINKVIKYFTGEGDLVFSNEPDKVYKARIASSIDFQRLVRYRTASVTFLVQPYKYKKDEAMKETEVVTKSGTNIILTDCANAPMRIETEAESVVVHGKNIVNAHELLTGTNKSIEVFEQGNKIIAIGGANASYASSHLTLPIQMCGKTYTVKYDNLTTEQNDVDARVQINVDTGSGVKYYSVPNATSKSVDISIPEGAKYVVIGIYTNNTGGALEVDNTVVVSGLRVVPTEFKNDAWTPYVAIQEATVEDGVALLNSHSPITVISNADNIAMSATYFKPFEVFNEGLESSRPLMILKGSGTVEISVNDVGIFTYTFPEGENEVYIDSEKEDAYLGSVLKNRNMNGEFPILLPKTNKIEWSGDVESIEILPRSRWL